MNTIRLAIYCIGITLILASCNLLPLDSGVPSSTHPASNPISTTPDTVQTGDSNIKSYVVSEHLNSTVILGRYKPEKNILTHTPEPPSAEQIGVRIAGHVAVNDGSGLADVRIYLSLAAYSGEIIATTDSNGDFQSGLKFIPGDENVTVWAELEGYSFNPPIYYWRHYYGLEERTINFSAQASTPTSSAQSTSNSNEILPAWVGTPAKGNPPRSELPLPEGICNGDIIIGQDNLLYFIWENTKSRIWFPATVDEKEVQSIPDGSDTDRQIVGQTQPDVGLGHLIVTTKADIYWLDTVRGMKYPLTAMLLLYDDLNSIPTTYGEQYFPVFR